MTEGRDGSPPGLPPVYGHEELRERLADAHRGGRLPSSLLFYGPEGVGKQRVALWLAALLQCESSGPCGECRHCRLARRLEHPDIHWFFPLSRPGGAGSPDKLKEKLEEARLEELEERRKNPVRQRREEGATGIYLAAVREIRDKASRRPASGPRCVFVIGDAEQMVPQAANPEAANAFLKLLEEPPPYCHVILTSSRPGALLPTVRSRVLAVRLSPLDDDTVERYVVREAGVDAGEAGRIATAARGSIGRALRLLSDEEREARDRAGKLLRLAVAGNRSARLRAALDLPPAGARGDFSRILETMEELLRDMIACTAGRPEQAFDRSRAERILRGHAPHPHGLLRAAEKVDEARRMAAANVNPQAVAAVLVSEMAEAFDEEG